MFRPYLAILRQLFTCRNRYVKAFQCHYIFVVRIETWMPQGEGGAGRDKELCTQTNVF
jgi:hypothetical protein